MSRLACPKCRKTFRTKKGLDWHMAHAHDSSQLLTSQAAFGLESDGGVNSNSALVHTRSRAIVKPQHQTTSRMACTRCEKTFRTQVGLDWHLGHAHHLAQPTAISPSEREQPTVSQQASFSASLSELGLSAWPYKALTRAGITTVSQLMAMNENELLVVWGLSRNGIREIKRKLNAYFGGPPYRPAHELRREHSKTAMDREKHDVVATTSSEIELVID